MVGNTAGGYDLLATSSLGITGGGAATWGTITGTLSSQTDLQNALDAKLSLSSWYATTTDGLAQGTINKYYSTLLFAADLAGTTTDALAQGSVNKYYANSLVQAFVHSSTTIPKTYTANTFTALQTITNASTTNLTASYASSTQGFFGSLAIGNFSGFLKATAGAVASALINLASDVTGTLGVGNGGTGWANIAASAIPFGNGSGALATTTAGTNGSVLAYLNGIPTWTATTTFSAPLTYSSGAVSIAAANGSTDGFLTSGDWTTFNGKQSALGFTPPPNTRSIATTYPLQGGGDLSADRTLSLAFGTTTTNSWSTPDILFAFRDERFDHQRNDDEPLHHLSHELRPRRRREWQSICSRDSTLSKISGTLALTPLANQTPTPSREPHGRAAAPTAIATSTFFAPVSAAKSSRGTPASRRGSPPPPSPTAPASPPHTAPPRTSGPSRTPARPSRSRSRPSTPRHNVRCDFFFHPNRWRLFRLIDRSGVVFPFASSTALSAGTLCLSADCRTSWPTAASTGDPFTHETWWGQANVSATTSALHLTGSPFSLFASSTAVFEFASSTAASTTRLTTGAQWFTFPLQLRPRRRCKRQSVRGGNEHTVDDQRHARAHAARQSSPQHRARQSHRWVRSTHRHLHHDALHRIERPSPRVPQRRVVQHRDHYQLMLLGHHTAYTSQSTSWSFTSTYGYPFTAASTIRSTYGTSAATTIIHPNRWGLLRILNGSGFRIPVRIIDRVHRERQRLLRDRRGRERRHRHHLAVGAAFHQPERHRGPRFVIGSSTATNFIVTNAGNVGIGTTPPNYALDVNGDVNVASGKCFRVNGVCIGYVKKLSRDIRDIDVGYDSRLRQQRSELFGRHIVAPRYDNRNGR